VSRLAGVFAPHGKGAPTAERLAEALGASAESASSGSITVAWTPGASAETTPTLAVAAGSSSLPPIVGALESAGGRFAVLRWDSDRGEGFLAVDPLAAASLFLYDDGSQLTFATEVADLLRILPRRPAPNPRAVVRWLADGSTERGDTLFEGVRRLPGGHVVRLSERGWRTDHYWSPRYAGIAEGDHETRLLEAVAAAVERATGNTSRAGVLLSGGLDSATVAAIAARRRGVRSYSAVFPDHPDIDETATIATLAEHFGLEAQRVPIGQISVLPAAEEYMQTWGLPPGSPLLAVHRPLLDRARADGVHALLDGQGGDELFGESPYLIADRLRTGRVGDAARLARVVAPNERNWRVLLDLGAKGTLPRAAHRALRAVRPRRYAPHWLQPDGVRSYVEERDAWSWKQLDGPRWWAFLADQLTAQRERSGVHDYLRHKSALAAADGRHPFLQDIELIRVVLALPPELAFDPVFDRPLLRRSVVGIVPDDVRLKTAKPHFTRIFVDAIGATDYEDIVNTLQPSAEVYAFVRPEAVERLLHASPQERRAFTWAWTLWRLAVCERWLQLQGDSS
jgi:asparagine synthase (glutamine-hydrolysing)